MNRVDQASEGTADPGQAVVEFALVLPFAALLLLGIVQVVLVARDQLAVEYAAREAARAAAVAADPATAASDAATAAIGLDPLEVSVDVTTTSRSGTGRLERVTATVRYRSDTDVPLIGPMVAAVEVVGSATMMREPPP
ncbi:MAG: hypothetical protein RLZZ01_401 [Actinomycetota bacterium]